MADETPVVSTVTGRHHPRDPRLTVFARWPWEPTGIFNELVKSELPKRERAFDPGEPGSGGRPKGWWVTSAQIDRICELLHQRFGRVRLETDDGTVEIGEGGEIVEEEQVRLI